MPVSYTHLPGLAVLLQVPAGGAFPARYGVDVLLSHEDPVYGCRKPGHDRRGDPADGIMEQVDVWPRILWCAAKVL